MRLSPCINVVNLKTPQTSFYKTTKKVNCTVNRIQITVQASVKALIFDCDGVIIESEGIHRQAYNDAFRNFDIRCNGNCEVVNWSVDFYDDLQNQVGGGKPKMRWYFGENGWPTSNILDAVPESDEDKGTLIDTVQDWKSLRYQEIIGGGLVEARPGVLRLMNEARKKGLKVAVCSAATKESVVFVLQKLLGKDVFYELDCFMAGDDVPKKKPDPIIYKLAAEKLRLQPNECVVIEDSAIGLQAALGADMRCIVTYTHSTKGQAFDGAEAVFETLGDGTPIVTIDNIISKSLVGQDDREKVGV